MAVSRDRFRALLSGLDAEEFARFVGDLWAARGREVRVSGAVVHVTDPATGERERVVVASRRLGRWRAPGGRTDRVVAPRDADGARRLADERDASFTAPEDLRRPLLYAVDRSECERLFRRHFGCAPGEVDGARRDRVVGPAASAVAVAVLLVVAAAALGVTTPAPRQETAGIGYENPAFEASTPTPDASKTLPTFPPGVTDDGVTDAGALAAAHAASLENRSYRWLVVRRVSCGAAFDGCWRESRRTVRVASSRRYTVIEQGNRSLLEGGTGPLSVVTYADGRRVYRRIRRENSTVYAAGPMERADRFRTRAGEYVARYLSAAQSDLSRAVYDGRNYHLIAVTGEPRRVGANVSNYTAFAIVSPDGFVRVLEVSYTRHGPAGPRRVRFTFRYPRVGDVAVPEPAWYGEARNATGTAP